MNVSEILRTAREMYAVNPSHAPADVYPCIGECPITAITKTCMAAKEWAVGRDAEEALEREMHGGPVPHWNAEHTTEEVLAAFDRAIAAEEASV